MALRAHEVTHAMHLMAGVPGCIHQDETLRVDEQVTILASARAPSCHCYLYCQASMRYFPCLISFPVYYLRFHHHIACLAHQMTGISRAVQPFVRHVSLQSNDDFQNRDKSACDRTKRSGDKNTITQVNVDVKATTALRRPTLTIEAYRLD